MLTIKTASADLKEIDEIRRLYNSSFPDDERIPWHRLFHQLDESHIMNIFYEADTPGRVHAATLGLLCTIVGSPIILGVRSLLNHFFKEVNF